MEALRAGHPAQVGEFRLLGRLGCGGMGQVYLGRAPHGELAAVKVVHDGLAGDPGFRARFGREIATARAVAAPWTARLVGADPDAAPPWLATQYVAGPPLHRVVAAGGGLAEAELTGLAARLAAALAELHTRGVVHRDLKPSNVLLAADGPRLIDFGIARALDATRITQTGMAIGTPAYMSPEQATGEREGLASDVFSLASVLVFAASGRGPFGATTTPVAVLRRIVHEAPDLSAVPERLRPVLARCLAKDPAARPTAAELAGSLAELAGPEPAWTQPPRSATGSTGSSPAYPVWVPESRPRRRRRVGIAVSVAVAALLLLCGTGSAVVAVSHQFDPADPAAPITPVLLPTSAPVPPLAAPPTPTGPQAPTTPQPSTSNQAGPAVVNVPLVPSRVAGWTPAVSTARNAAYDVPTDWHYGSPGHVKGYYSPSHEMIVMSGIAEHGALTCPGENWPQADAWAGVTGAPVANTSTAATSVARLWAAYYRVDSVQPSIQLDRPIAVTVGDLQGSYVVAKVVKPAGACGAATAQVHTVALPGRGGQTVVWVLLADTGTVTAGDVQQMIASVRPAGLQAKCEPSRQATGSWC